MPRLPRLHVPGGHYHVILRGNHREALFSTDADRDVLNNIVAEALTQEQARIHAFCWMSNHLHALIQIADDPLGGLMHRIARRYSRYRHRQLRTTGHLFERRYKAWLVDVDNYFVALLRYIHLNPVAARIVDHAADYPWSSHRAYMGECIVSWLTTDFGLALFGTTTEAARLSYRQFITGSLYASEERLLEEAHPDDARILGTDHFVANLTPQKVPPSEQGTLSQLAERICNDHKISLELVCSMSRLRSLTPVRVEIASQAIDRRIASLREVSEFLGREPASLSELLARYRY